MANPSQHKTVILSAPQGYGKTTRADALMKAHHCCCVIDEWHPQMPLTSGALHLTNIHPEKLADQIKGLDFDQLITAGWPEGS